jgi:uncharacterized membrane protein SirB2
MTPYYMILRHVHIACAVLTIALFTLRGVLMFVESPWLESRVLKILPHAVDTVLLTAALMLTTIVHQYPFANGWLTMKLALLVVYVVLGSIALKRGRTLRVRVVAFVAAMLTVAFLVSVALAHDPRGIFAA